MYSKKLSFTNTQLNTLATQSGTIAIKMVPSGLVGGSDPYWMYPSNMKITNDTGQTINFGLIASDEQFVEYQADNTNFALIPIKNGITMPPDELAPLPRSKYLLVQCPSGTVSIGLDVYFMNYARK